MKTKMPGPLKAKLTHGYRAAESHIFGRITNMPGEHETISNELGIGGMGTTFGQRMQIRRGGMAEANPPEPSDTGSSDLYQSVLSRLSGESQ